MVDSFGTISPCLDYFEFISSKDDSGNPRGPVQNKGFHGRILFWDHMHIRETSEREIEREREMRGRYLEIIFPSKAMRPLLCSSV